MSANQYEITILNQSALDQQYLLFQTSPTPNEQPSSTVFLNVYQASPIVPKPTAQGEVSRASFTITEQWYAINGTAPSPLNANVTVNTSESEPVTLGAGATKGTTLSLTTINSDGEDPKFDDSKTMAAAPNGAFQIVADTTFRFPNGNNIFIGLGAPDPLDASNILPTASIAALPGVTETIWPHNKWYISTGSFEQGEIIDTQSLTTTPLEVDFEAGLPKQTFTNNSDGTFTPVA
ncbi:uncharacterized protein FPRO_08867 [Fusarium proliferatum ET1]|uniref:Uncharacterized protein n=1 Tax=Fusarium proliferatum (strain ET1) TaxID=1227346 RepID=A0A1L7WA80_FUSPR|nr:uncharacterized protein FPRO_08867 [Fusarium proliferatum ET1]CZR49392.1 uncharacterized protein FPRO_08867 [Fusarium proliferatum ET1]